MEKKRILLTEAPADYVRINSGLGPSRTAQYHRACRSSSRARCGPWWSWPRFSVQRDTPGLPRSAHREHRSRAEHGRSQYHHRQLSSNSPVTGRGPPLPTGRTPRLATRISAPDEAVWPSRTARPKRRIRGRAGQGLSRRRRANSPSRRNTSPSSSPTCPTSCAPPEQSPDTGRAARREPG